MAEGRMLRRKIAINKALAQLPTDRARLVFTWCIPFLDVEGRMTGDSEVIKALVFPLIKTIGPETIEEDIAECARVGLVNAYTVDSERYLSFPGFPRNQQVRRDREAESTIPPPPGTPVERAHGERAGDTPGERPAASRSTPAQTKRSETNGREGNSSKAKGNGSLKDKNPDSLSFDSLYCRIVETTGEDTPAFKGDCRTRLLWCGQPMIEAALSTTKAHAREGGEFKKSPSAFFLGVLNKMAAEQGLNVKALKRRVSQ